MNEAINENKLVAKSQVLFNIINLFMRCSSLDLSVIVPYARLNKQSLFLRHVVHQYVIRK